jgi:FkbH-like protein
MSDGDAGSRLRAKAEARAYERRLAAGEETPDYRVGLAATFTAEGLGPFLVHGLMSAGLRPALYRAPYNQLHQACLDHRRSFGAGEELDAVVLLWRIEEVLAQELEGFVAGDPSALTAARGKIQDLGRAVAALRQAFGGVIVAGTPPFPHSATSDLLDPAGIGTGGRFHAEVRDAWLHELGPAAAVLTFDLDALQRYHGASRAADARTWYLYRQPYREEFLALVGERLAALLRLTRTPPRKCAALDGDGTLWAGIVGEDGADGVQIGGDFPGSAYRDLQKLLLHWRRQGVLLVLLSRNNEADVWEVFDRRPEMVLRREDISAWRIDWQPKPDNLRALAQALNLGLDSFVFIDDDPVEVERMRAAWPEVACVLLPADPARIVEEVVRHRLFERLETTSEDKRRAGMMADEGRRSELRSRLSPEEFLASLDLRVRVFEAGEEHLARITQLVNKTNQFNLTTIRRDQAEVRRLMAAPGCLVYGLTARDRFGDYGLTGAAIVQDRGTACEIDTFLLSCRILGREVETAFLAALARAAGGRDRREIVARYVPTAKNAPAADFLPRHGFARDPAGGWKAALAAIPPVPGHVTLAVGD